MNCTFFIHVQPFAAYGGGIVKAVGHFTMVRSSTAPPNRQQESGLSWILVDHVVEASSTMQEGFVEEPLVPWKRSLRCLAVEPQVNRSIVFSNVIVVMHRHWPSNRDCWRTEASWMTIKRK